MRKLLTLMLLLSGGLLFSQEQQTVKESKSFEEILKPYVERTLEGLEKGVEYASQEVPIVLKQYVLYEAVSSWLIVLVSLIILIWFWVYTIKKWKDEESWFYGKYDNPGIGFTIFGGILITLITAMLISFNIGVAIKATFFPKLFLVEKFIELF